MTLKRNLGLVAAVLLLAAFAPARASDRDETEVTVQVSVGGPRARGGLFLARRQRDDDGHAGLGSLRFLARQRGHRVTITLVESTGRQLSHLGGGQ